jgi:ABC-type Mn2+/Zn2+ transport system ATPase subunit
VISAEDLGVSYGPLVALHGMTVTLDRGELVALIGPNGAGKTTLLKALAGLVAHTGSIIRCEPVHVAYLPQRLGFDPGFPITAGRLVATGRRRFTGPWRRLRPVDRAAVEAALAQVGLPDVAARPVEELSGGQLQRVVLARALAQEADVLLLDEPLSGVDTPGRAELVGLLGELAATGRTVVVSTHDLGLVRTRFARCIAVNRTVLADGPAADALDPATLDGIFRTPEPGPREVAWTG